MLLHAALRFGAFTLDLGTRRLMQGSRDVHLTPKAFDLLSTLVNERPNVLSKADLQQRLWPTTFVDEANLSNLVAEIRQALGDPSRTPLFIRTVHGFGYAFSAADVAGLPPLEQEGDAAVESPTSWLEWGRRRFPLSVGQHVVGRDADVEIRLDQPTVSRRHARFVVTHAGTLLEDFASKNGTFLGEARVTSPVPLADGDDIRIGSLRMTFHVRALGGPTDTLETAP